MVASPHLLASQAGIGALRRGGNALDAAIAAAATIAVVYPHMNGLGGDNVWLIYDAGRGVLKALCGIGRSARAASIEWYAARSVRDAIPSRGGLAALTVPGAVDGWWQAHRYSREAMGSALAWRDPDTVQKILERTSQICAEALRLQIEAGADCVQIFDTWAGVLPPREFLRWSIALTARIVEGVRAKVPNAKIIGFPRGAGALLPAYVGATKVDGVSIDWAAEPSLIRERVQNKVAVQGNLDPLALIAGGAALDRAVDDVLANYGQGRLIFNLGHGILPETPIAHVEQMIRRVRDFRG